jgi:hypothetical protein
MSYLDDLPDLGMGGKRRRRRRTASASDEGGQRSDEQALTYPRYICRECGGPCRVYSSEGRVRRHKCTICGHTFKTTEEVVKG